jgi:hypothetical protein
MNQSCELYILSATGRRLGKLASTLFCVVGELDLSPYDRASRPGVGYALLRTDFDHILGTFPLVFPDTDAGRRKREALLGVHDEWAAVVAH